MSVLAAAPWPLPMAWPAAAASGRPAGRTGGAAAVAAPSGVGAGAGGPACGDAGGLFAFGSFSVAFGAFSFGSFTFGSFDGAVAAESFPSGLPVAFGVAASFVFGDAEVGAAFGGLSFLGFGLTFGAFTLGMTGFGVVEVGFEPEPDAGGSCSPVGAAPSTGGEE